MVRDLYGLKSASAAFQAYIPDKLDEMGLKSSVAEPDVWMRPAVKPDGEEYYEYILIYVDDILKISMQTRYVMEDIEQRFKLKNDKVEEPSSYLGARLKKKVINGWDCWTVMSLDYVKAAVATVEEAIKKTTRNLPKTFLTPMVQSYLPELDATEELEPDDIQFSQELIVMLRWATEIGRVDVLLETSLLSQHQAYPREGHMVQALHIFAYLKKKPKLTLYYDPVLPRMDYHNFRTKREDFLEHYRNAAEPMPHHQPRTRGQSVTTT